jgi:hypothetical protein
VGPDRAGSIATTMQEEEYFVGFGPAGSDPLCGYSVDVYFLISAVVKFAWYHICQPLEGCTGELRIIVCCLAYILLQAQHIVNGKRAEIHFCLVLINLGFKIEQLVSQRPKRILRKTKRTQS